MKFETIVKRVNEILPLIWLEEEKYIQKQELHNRILEYLNLKHSKQKNSKFCRMLKGVIHATINCKEVTIKGYHKYKRL